MVGASGSLLRRMHTQQKASTARTAAEPITRGASCSDPRPSMRSTAFASGSEGGGGGGDG